MNTQSKTFSTKSNARRWALQQNLVNFVLDTQEDGRVAVNLIAEAPVVTPTFEVVNPAEMPPVPASLRREPAAPVSRKLETVVEEPVVPGTPSGRDLKAEQKAAKAKLAAEKRANRPAKLKPCTDHREVAVVTNLRKPDAAAPKAGTNATKLVDRLCDPAGATHKELCEFIGWAQCLPYTLAAAARMGVAVTKRREGKEVRYWGKR